MKNGLLVELANFYSIGLTESPPLPPKSGGNRTLVTTNLGGTGLFLPQIWGKTLLPPDLGGWGGDYLSFILETKRDWRRCHKILIIG